MTYAELTPRKKVTTRKPHVCEWCGELIPAGTKEIWYRAFVYQDGPQSGWMHPECETACANCDPADLADGWEPGDFPRGSCEPR
jgi:hypothetical protein